MPRRVTSCSSKIYISLYIMKTDVCRLLLLLLLLLLHLWTLPAEFTGLLVGRLTRSLFSLFNEQELLTGPGLSGGVRRLSGLFFFFFFLNRSLDLAAHFKQVFFLGLVSIRGVMGGASRFLQSTILFDWGFSKRFYCCCRRCKKEQLEPFFVFFEGNNYQQRRTELIQTSEQIEMMPGCTISYLDCQLHTSI